MQITKEMAREAKAMKPAPNAFTTQHQPIKKAPIAIHATVYDLKTGKKYTCAPIDAKERIARGGWAYEMPEPEAKEVEKVKEPEKIESVVVAESAKDATESAVIAEEPQAPVPQTPTRKPIGRPKGKK